MNATMCPLLLATASFLSTVGLVGCGEVAKPQSGDKSHVITQRDWPDQHLTGGDGEVAQRQHLLVDQKVVDVWTNMIGSSGSSQVRILIGLREHTMDELKNWKVRIACQTLWADFTTATLNLADGRFAQHPDYKNGVVVFRDTHEFYNTPGTIRPGLTRGSHTATVELLDDKGRVQGTATFGFNVYKPYP